MKIKVNNVELYYEEYGTGKPIILLHGNQETHKIFDKLIEQLKKKHKVEVNSVEYIYNLLKKENYKITFEIEENWYRQDNKLLGNREFLVQDPDGYLLRFSEDLGEKEKFND